MTSGLLAKYAFLNFLGLAVPALTGLITLPFVVRWLGTERFGVFSWLMVVMNYFALFEFGLSRATVKYVADALGREEFGRIPRVVWSAVAFQAVSGLVGSAILVLATPFILSRFLKMPAALMPEARAALTWVAVVLPVNTILPSFRGALEAAHRFGLVNAVKIPTNALVFIAPFLGALFRLDLEGMVILFVVSRALSLVVWILAAGHVFPGLAKVGFLARPDRRRVFIFGGWNMLSAVVWPVLASLDRFFIGAQVGAKAVGFYAPPSEGINKLGIIPGSLQLALFPAFSLLSANVSRAKAKSLFAKSVKYTLLVIGPLVVVIAVFAKWILNLWLGEEFARTSASVLQILAVSYLLQSLTYVPFSYLQGLGRADVTSLIQLSVLVGVLPVFFVSIKFWGIIGAAAAVGIRSGLELGLLLRSAWRQGGLDAPALAGEKIIRLAFALAVLGSWSFLWRRLTDGLPGLLAVTVALSMFAVFSWARVLDEEERGRLRRLFRRSRE
jgi:O-antigen/teichoic acid export membrane protein